MMYVTYHFWTRIEGAPGAPKLKSVCKFLLAYNLHPSCKRVQLGLAWVD